MNLENFFCLKIVVKIYEESIFSLFLRQIGRTVVNYSMNNPIKSKGAKSFKRHNYEIFCIFLKLQGRVSLKRTVVASVLKNFN
jgi:hypothetical protein